MTANRTTKGPLLSPWQKPVLGTILLQPEAALLKPERLVQPDAWVGHIPFAFWLVAAARPRRYVELGVHTGNSYCAFNQALSCYGIEADCFGIDHWLGDGHAGLYGEDIFAELSNWHDPKYGAFSTLLRMSFADGRTHIADGSVDILHIDGLHTYEAVREDFESWQKKLSDRSIVLFHDTNVYRDDFGVWRYWDEVAARYPTVEFLHSNGLGLAYTGRRPLDELAQPIASLFNMAQNHEALETVREFFAGLGSGMVARLELEASRSLNEKAFRKLQSAHEHQLAQQAEKLKSLEASAEKWERLAARLRATTGLEPKQVGQALRSLRAMAQKIGSTVRGKGVRRLSVTDYGELFDETHYGLSQEARRTGMDPLQHYLRIGEAQGIAPSARFDPQYYASRYPDIAAAGLGLLDHYVQFGRAEGRLAIAPAAQLQVPDLAETEKPRVALLLDAPQLHESAVLAWNLAGELGKTHSVIGVLAYQSEFRPAFEAVCAAVVELPETQGLAPSDISLMARRIAEKAQPDFAISFGGNGTFAAGLAAANVGVVYVFDPAGSVPIEPSNPLQTLSWAHRIVTFDAETGTDLARSYPEMAQRSFNTQIGCATRPLPSPHPSGHGNKAGNVLSQSADGRFMILGAGEISERKGIDLFIDVAAVTFHKAKQKPCFVWACPTGQGQNEPYLDDLKAKIARVGLEGHLDIVLGTNAYMEAFKGADAFALTARADPLALDAINALAKGVPVVAFEGKSGVQAMLKAHPHSEIARLVVPPLDLWAMSERLSGLANDPIAHDGAKRAVLEHLAPGLDGSHYCAAIAGLGQKAKADARHVADQYARLHTFANASSTTLLKGSDAALDPYGAPHGSPLNAYLVRWQTLTQDNTLPSVVVRRPIPGFHPTIYAEDVLKDDLSINPLLDWLEKGRPSGRWTHRVIGLDAGTPPAVTSTKALLHAHFYYSDLFEEFLARLNLNGNAIDLVVTTSDSEVRDLERIAARQPFTGNLEIVVTPNIGRDIGPFLTGPVRERASGYEIVGHVHEKKTNHVSSAQADQWRNFLWEHTVGGQTAAADACIQALVEDKSLGLVFPEDSNLWGWGGNRRLAADLAQRAGMPTSFPSAFEFPAGTMFWARRAALEPLYGLDFAWQDYPREPLPSDGTMLHALERLVPFAAQQMGFGYATTYLASAQNCSFI